MDELDGILCMVAVLALGAAVLLLAAKVSGLAEDIDLMNVAAGNPGTLLEAKRMIEARRAERAERNDL